MAKRVEPVGILENPRLEGGGRDAGGETMRGDRMRDIADVFSGPAEPLENLGGTFRREEGGP